MSLQVESVYTRKYSPNSSHEIILKQISKCEGILDLGSSNDILFAELKKRADEVICVDMTPASEVSIPSDNYIQCNLEKFEELKLEDKYDYIILADVIEHLRNAPEFLEYIKRFLKDDGQIIISVPNIAVFVYRLSLLFGRFDYTEKGTLDKTHVYFYTKKTILELVEGLNFKVNAFIPTTLPFEVAFSKILPRFIISSIDLVYNVFANLWQKMFAYQFVLIVQK